MGAFHPIWLIVFAAALALIPVLLALVTSYLKVSIVLGMLRASLGTPQVPSAAVLMALSMALTFYIMAPVGKQTLEILRQQPSMQFDTMPGRKDWKGMLAILGPLQDFLRQHAGEREKQFFMKTANDLEIGGLASGEPFAGEDSLHVLLPAFVFSELKQAFAMGFAVMLPFLVIDIIVANILVGMGMYMVSPMMISLPLKLMLFVLSDAWLLLARGLIYSYGS